MSLLARTIRRLAPEKYRPIGYLTRLVRERTGGSVQQGPFAGMQYIDHAVGSAYLPKLLGVYEREIANCIESICRRRPELIVDVGAGEGYYAVGLARRNPQARLVAFEMNPLGQEALSNLAQRNDVGDRIEIRGRCEPSSLAAALHGANQPVIVCDVEGDELTLLDPIAAPALRGATILVELHEFAAPGVGRELRNRFHNSHRIEEISQQPRSGDEFPWSTWGTRLLPRRYLEWAVSEWRPAPMSWLWMEPLSSP